VLESGSGGDAEPQVLGHQRHRRHQQQRITYRDLGGLADRGFVTGPKDVVGAQHIGDEQAVKPSALQQLCELGPVGQVLVAPGLILRVPRQPGGLVGDAVHVERIEADHTGHCTEAAGAARQSAVAFSRIVFGGERVVNERRTVRPDSGAGARQPRH